MDDELSPRKAAIAAYMIAALAPDDRNPLFGAIDLDSVAASVAALKAAFPPSTLHAFAAKANAIPGVLSYLASLDLGCEVASPGEFRLAKAAGFPPARMVFDSPAKTESEIAEALAFGAMLNIDNFQELARVDKQLAAGRPIAAPIGIRVNPQIGIGRIAAMSTAGITGKFGIGLEDGENRRLLIEAYRGRPWLRALHVHVGSQGCPLDLIAAGIAKARDFARAVNAAIGGPQIAWLDIGGGLPVNFAGEAMTPSFADYADCLARSVPGLFSGEFRLVTEFGRSLLAKAGFLIARVEYTKETGERAIAITHAGAQVATRTVFMPEQWPIRISALDPQGMVKREARIEQDIAGPCCFAGDIIAHRRLLPRLDPGDFILAHDTGAYYFSTPFIYNSLPGIAVYGVSGPDGALRHRLLQPAQDWL